MVHSFFISYTFFLSLMLLLHQNQLIIKYFEYILGISSLRRRYFVMCYCTKFLVMTAFHEYHDTTKAITSSSIRFTVAHSTRYPWMKWTTFFHIQHIYNGPNTCATCTLKHVFSLLSLFSFITLPLFSFIDIFILHIVTPTTTASFNTVYCCYYCLY